MCSSAWERERKRRKEREIWTRDESNLLSGLLSNGRWTGEIAQPITALHVPRTPLHPWLNRLQPRRSGLKEKHAEREHEKEKKKRNWKFKEDRKRRSGGRSRELSQSCRNFGSKCLLFINLYWINNTYIFFYRVCQGRARDFCGVYAWCYVIIILLPLFLQIVCLHNSGIRFHRIQLYQTVLWSIFIPWGKQSNRWTQTNIPIVACHFQLPTHSFRILKQ